MFMYKIIMWINMKFNIRFLSLVMMTEMSVQRRSTISVMIPSKECSWILCLFCPPVQHTELSCNHVITKADYAADLCSN